MPENARTYAIVARNLVLASELVTIARALRRTGVDCVVLKGIPLTQRLFGRLDARAMIDNDILVHRADARRAEAALRELGYEPFRWTTLEADLRFGYHHSMLRRHSTSIDLSAELHWTAFPPLLFDVAEALQWARTEPFNLGRTEVKVFDPTMTIVHLASHYIQHHFCVPRILSDLAQAWTKWHSTLDLDDLRSLAAHTGVLPTLEYALHAAHELGLTPAAPLEWESPAAARLRRILPPARLLETPRGRGYARTLASLLLVKPGSAAAWLLRSTLPPPEVMSAIYEEPVIGRLDWHYLARFGRPLVRLWRARGARSGVRCGCQPKAQRPAR